MRTVNYCLICLLATVLLGAACVKPKTNIDAKQPQTQGGPPSGADSTQGSTSGQQETPPGATNGALVTQTSGAPPQGWPADVPIMQGFTVVNGAVSSQQMLSVFAKGTVSLDDVSNFYSTLSGWQKDPNAPWITKGSQRVLRLIRGQGHLSIQANPNKDQTDLTLTYWVR
jgi:hypothetical protein